MLYVTQQNMIDRFGEQEIIQLTDRSIPPVNAINVAKLTAALTDASALADSYLEGRVTLPLAEVPSMLLKPVADISRMYLYDDHIPEYVMDNFDAAMQTLEGISQGKINLGLSSNNGKATQGVIAEVVSGGRVFDRNNSKGFI